MIKHILLVLITVLFSTTTIADDYVVNVNGLVCEFCAIGVTKKVSKLAFIDNSKYIKGVKVEIEDQMVTIAVKEGSELDKDALFSAIEAGGYKPVDIWKLSPKGEKTPL